MESRVPHHIPGLSSSLVSQPLLDSRTPYPHLPHPVTIYPIDQMKSSHVENDYIDSPAVVSQQPAPSSAPGSQKTSSRRITWLGQSQEAFLGANQNQHHNHHHHHHHHHHHQHPGPGRCEPHQDTTTHPWISFSGRPSSISSSSSTSSDQRLLDHVAPTPTVDHHHHHHHHHPHHHSSVNTITNPRTPDGCLSSSNAKVLTSSSSTTSTSSSTSSSSKSLDVKPGKASAPAGSPHAGSPPVSALIPSSPAEKKHLLLCERCGKCRCTECTLPRPLPSCWVCNQECLCSARSLVDAATCMCLVKGVFYHCGEDEDEEGSCADRPCSCSQAHCCARWSFMAALAVALPCLVCYLPATGLAKLGQKCYDSASRPGCRCKHSQGGVVGTQKGDGGGGGGGVKAKALGKQPQGS